ncbi:MAG: hypothetical protein JSS02_05615 [Planctomycetes bacterium]|nr:hypothetical protein [Planctomycetota bacterium]
MIRRLSCLLSTVVLGLVILFGVTPSWASDDDEKRAAELADKVLAHRRKIQSGIFRFDSRLVFYRDGKPERKKNEQIDVWIDGSSRRADYHRTGDGEEIVGNYRNSVTITDEVLIFYNDQKFVDGSHLVSTLNKPDGPRSKILHQVFDPRLVGMNTDTLANTVKRKLDSLIGKRADTKAIRLEAGRFEDLPCQVVHVFGNGELEIVIWYADDRDGNFVRIECRAEQFRQVAEITHSKVEGYGWFPSNVTVTWYDRGSDDIARREVLDIEVKQINQPVDAETFRIKGIDVPVGTHFIDYREAQPKMLVVKEKGADPVPGKP